MEPATQSSKLEKMYEDTMARAVAHLEELRDPEQGSRVESDKIFQHIQYTIDCLQYSMARLEKGSETRQKYARYKDELGDEGKEIVALINPDRW